MADGKYITVGSGDRTCSYYCGDTRGVYAGNSENEL